MRINIKYFGQIAEVTQKEEESLEFSGIFVSDLLNSLFSTYSELKNTSFKVAQNQELISNTTKVTGAEIALLPPFSGG